MKRYLTFAVSLLPMSPALAQQASSGSQNSDIVVTGQSLRQTETALQECVARRCPVDQDVAATLRHAENQFVAGKYKDARTTLLASVRRNKKADKQYPVLVASLYRANGRVAAHLGEGESYRLSTISSLDALRSGLPDNDPRVIAQRVEIGDMFANIGRIDAAIGVYNQVVRDAHAANLPGIEGPARLRIANIKVQAAQGSTLASNAAREAIAELDLLSQESNTALAPYRFVAKLLKARLYARHGDSGPFDTLIAELRTRPALSSPVLLDAKPINLDDRTQVRKSLDQNTLLTQSMTASIPTGDFEDQWIDVSFLIKADGTVSDADVVRQSKETVGPWSSAVLSSINSRRYAPVSLAPNEPGLLRVERYTYTATIQDVSTESRMRTRGTTPRIEMMDLTTDSSRAKS